MAKNTITYSCGHTTVEQLYGPMARRELAIKHALGRLCPACYAARLEAERAAESAAAAEAAKAAGLPALTGSEKQVAWAEAIRARQLPAMRELDLAMANAPAKTDQQIEAVRIGREIIAEAIARTDAKSWIDNRDVAIDRTWLAHQVKARMAQ